MEQKNCKRTQKCRMYFQEDYLHISDEKCQIYMNFRKKNSKQLIFCVLDFVLFKMKTMTSRQFNVYQRGHEE